MWSSVLRIFVLQTERMKTEGHSLVLKWQNILTEMAGLINFIFLSEIC
jgi:hypothetical protein